MDIDYNDEIIKLVSKLKDCSEYMEVINDYYQVKELSYFKKLNDNQINYIRNVRSKYDKEINIISNIRFNYYISIGKSTTIEDSNNIYNEICFLLAYLPRILIFKYTNNYLKGKVNSEMENKLYCEDSMVAFEVVKVLI